MRLESEAFHYHVNTDTSDQNVGRSVRALYDSGWNVGKIAHCNKTLQENKIDYRDNSIGYISPSEIGGAGVYFVDIIESFFRWISI